MGEKGGIVKRRLTIVAAFALLFTAAVMHGPDGGTGRHRMEAKR
jgi:hypothetical protein